MLGSARLISCEINIRLISKEVSQVEREYMCTITAINALDPPIDMF